jgi:hypothetical protein
VFNEYNYEKYESYKMYPLFKYLERFAQIGGFIKDLSKEIHDVEVSKIEEDEKRNIQNHAPAENGMREDKDDKEESQNMADQEPLFVNPNNKSYLNSNNSQLPEDDRNKISCDEVFAIYLYDISRRVNPEFFKVMIRFIFAYRECLNKYGWEKKAENDEVLNNSGNGEEMETTMITPASEIIIQKSKELKSKAQGLEFSVINNAEHAPEI